MNYDSLTVTIFSQVLRMCIWKCFLVHVDNSYVFLSFQNNGKNSQENLEEK